MKIETIVDIITLILSLFILIFGLTNYFFKLISDQLFFLLLSFLLSVGTIIIGNRLSLMIKEYKKDKEDKKFHQTILNSIQDINSIIEFPNSNTALEYLNSRIENAKFVLNTKISNSTEPEKFQAINEYKKKLKISLKNGLKYIDILTPTFKSYAQNLSDYTKNYKGTYKYKIINFEDKSILNFIILKYKNDDDEELIIGWIASSSFGGDEQKAYLIRDKRIIKYFRTYHTVLFNSKE